MNRAIFLDRDGTLNEDEGYVHMLEDFKLLPGVIEGLKMLQEHFLFFIITNQSGIGRGYYTESQFLAFNNLVCESLKKQGIIIQKTYHCPHIYEDNCKCRKPNTFFIDQIAQGYMIDVKASWVIGDHPSDVKLGINAECSTIYICTGDGTKHFHELKEKDINPTFIARDFLTAAHYIKKSL